MTLCRTYVIQNKEFSPPIPRVWSGAGEAGFVVLRKLHLLGVRRRSLVGIRGDGYLHANRFCVMLTEPPVTQEIELDCEEL